MVRTSTRATPTPEMPNVVTRARKFLALSGLERRTFVAAWWELLRVRWALRTMVFAQLQKRRTEALRPKAMASAAEGTDGTSSADDRARVGWAVSSAARFVPGATCLPQAMAAQALLARRGIGSIIQTGFDRTDAKGVEGHAWLVCDGEVVVGDIGLDRFVPVASFEL
ncbi:MAG: lasso peptide biosynthesis B2 protein [Trueperaceae bacterium]